VADIEVYQRALERERKARREAEKLLEDKSLELYDTLKALKATAVELQDEVVKTRAVLQTAADGIIAFDADGTIESINPAAEQIFQYDSQSLVGKNLLSLLPTNEESNKAEPPSEDWWTSPPDAVEQTKNKDENASRNVFGKRRSGEIFEMELAASRVRLEERWLYTWVVRDVSRRRNLERQLSVAQRLESVGQLAAGVAHEINTPIQFVGDNLAFLNESFKNWAELYEKHEQLHKECQSLPDLAPLCEEITNAAEAMQLDFLREEMPAAIEQSVGGVSRVADIVRSMKEFSHPGGKAKSPMNINDAIESTLTVSRNEWKYIADVQTELDPALPTIRCFPGDLNQAFLNLIVNAAQAIAEKRQSPGNSDDIDTITVSTRVDGDEIEIRFADTGPGIPPETQQRIFDPFFTTKPVGVGSGQGLSIVYSIVVDRHQGKLSVESTFGKGTTFIVRLPIAETSSDAPKLKSPKSEETDHAGTHPLR